MPISKYNTYDLVTSGERIRGHRNDLQDWEVPEFGICDDIFSERVMTLVSDLEILREITHCRWSEPNGL